MVFKGDVILASAIAGAAADTLLPPDTILPFLGVIAAGGLGGALFAVMSAPAIALGTGLRLFIARGLLSFFCSGSAYYVMQGYVGHLGQSIPQTLAVMTVSFCVAAHKEMRNTLADAWSFFRAIRGAGKT